MSARKKPATPDEYTLVKRIKLDPPANGSMRLLPGAVLIEDILRHYYLHQGQVVRRGTPYLGTMTWRQPEPKLS